jgi:large subunit ribosomal protein L29
MKTSELRLKNDQELSTLVREAHKVHFNLKMQAATGRVDGQKKIKETKRLIARIFTVAKERKLKNV